MSSLFVQNGALVITSETGNTYLPVAEPTSLFCSARHETRRQPGMAKNTVPHICFTDDLRFSITLFVTF